MQSRQNLHQSSAMLNSSGSEDADLLMWFSDFARVCNPYTPISETEHASMDNDGAVILSISGRGEGMCCPHSVLSPRGRCPLSGAASRSSTGGCGGAREAATSTAGGLEATADYRWIHNNITPNLTSMEFKTACPILIWISVSLKKQPQEPEDVLSPEGDPAPTWKDMLKQISQKSWEHFVMFYQVLLFNN